jgi:hypothetical protein
MPAVLLAAQGSHGQECATVGSLGALADDLLKETLAP